MEINYKHIDICREVLGWLCLEIGTEIIDVNITEFRNYIVSIFDDDFRSSIKCTIREVPDSIVKLTTFDMSKKKVEVNFWRQVAKYLTKYSIDHNKYCESYVENDKIILKISSF